MLCGSLVFLQTDPTFYEWWNVGMQPYVHFVPFATADELVERVEEYAKKPDEAATIAAAGYELAKRAFREMDDYVDEFLVQYRNATTGLNQRICTSKGGDRATVTEYKTLEQIQQESKADPAGGYCL
jgi:spore maturation protein CgeB